ncbi:MAG: hypothetical protein IKO84_12625 [Butyrivibrio sp.]|nr:hypothetical protein [Butyrivibrio sp.]
MSELSKRAAKYYFIQGIKLVMVSLLVLIFGGVMWTFFSMGEANAFEHVLNMIFSFGTLFMIMLNFLYSMYSPAWYDSLVLSMGARRKDVFFGELLKQITFIIGTVLIYIILAVSLHRPEHIITILTCSIISLLMGAVGLIVGHKIKKYGRVVYIIFVFVNAALFATIGIRQADGKTLIDAHADSRYVIVSAALLLFAILEFVVYRINKKAMVV